MEYSPRIPGLLKFHVPQLGPRQLDGLINLIFVAKHLIHAHWREFEAGVTWVFPRLFELLQCAFEVRDVPNLIYCCSKLALRKVVILG